MRLIQMRKQARDEAMERIEAIQDAAADDNGRDLTDEEEAETAELRATFDRLDAQIAAMAQDEQRAANAAQVPERPSRRSADQPTPPQRTVVEVRSEPITYGGAAGFRLFLMDLAASQGIGSRGFGPEARTRLQDHAAQVLAEWASTDEVRMAGYDSMTGVVNPWPTLGNPHRSDEVRAVVKTGGLAAVVNQMDQPGFISRGIYPNGVTTRLLRRVPMTTEGMSVLWPRVTTKASSAVQAGEGADFHEGSFATSGVVVPVFTVASKLPMSVQAVERGSMTVELVQSEMADSHMDVLNANILFGNANASNSDQPAGILWAGTGKTATFVTWDDATKGNRTVTAFADQLNSVIDTLWSALLMAPDAIIMGPTLWGKLRTWTDSTGRPMYGLNLITAQNPIGVADRVPMTEEPSMVGDFYGIPLFVDAWITNTFKADDSATTGGTETRIIVMQRRAVPVAFDGPMAYVFEQTLAGSGQQLLVCRGYAAFNAGWRPEGLRVLTGSGTAVDGGDGSKVSLDASDVVASLTKAERTRLLEDIAERTARLQAGADTDGE